MSDKFQRMMNQLMSINANTQHLCNALDGALERTEKKLKVISNSTARTADVQAECVDKKIKAPFGYCSQCGKPLSLRLAEDGGTIHYCLKCCASKYVRPPYGICPHCQKALHLIYKNFGDKELMAHCLQCGHTAEIKEAGDA